MTSLKISKKYMIGFLLLCVMLIILVVSEGKYNAPYSKYPLKYEGQEYSLYFNETQLYITINQESYSIESEENLRFFHVATGDLTKNGRDEILALVGKKSSKFAEELLIYDLELNDKGMHFNRLYSNDIALIQPWMIRTCEIDADGELEVFIGVNKGTHFYKEVENRPFFFNFKDGILIKKWTGSKFRNPFVDIYFADLNNNGRDEIIVIEEVEEGKVIAVYYWFGFGFVLQAESRIYDEILDFTVNKSDTDVVLELRVKDEMGIRSTTLESSKELTQSGIYYLKERGH